MSWIDKLWEIVFEKNKSPEMSTVYPLVQPVLISGTYNGNYVEGELYKPPHFKKAILYCHGGFADGITPDVGAYVNTGNLTLHVDYEAEGDVFNSNPDRDVIELVDSAEMVKTLYGVTDIDLVGSSRGAYAALKAFGHHPDKFRRVVAMMGPINMNDPAYPYDWSVWGAQSPKHLAMIEGAKKYFATSLDPTQMAKAEMYKGLESRILLIYGSEDPICPLEDMMIPFCEITKVKGIKIEGASHNVHRTKDGQIYAVTFLNRR